MAKKTTAKKVSPDQRMLVTFLLDRSGSMQSCKAATIESFNGYLATLQDETAEGLAPDKIEFTFLQFDSQSLDKVCVAIPVKDAQQLTKETFVPRGGTPLLKAATNTINAVAASLSKRADKPKVVICIQTDGQENESGPEYSYASLSALIAEKEKLGWQFNFMGAGIDNYAAGAAMGFSRASTMSYDSHNLAASAAGFRATASNARSFGAGMSVNTNYSMAQKAASGDRFDPDLQRHALAQAMLYQQAGNLAPPLDLTAPAAPPARVETVDDFTL